MPEPPERVVQFRPQTILMVLGILIGVAITLEVIWIARHVIAWVLMQALEYLERNTDPKYRRRKAATR